MNETPALRPADPTTRARRPNSLQSIDHIKGIKGIKGIGRRDVHPPASTPESSPAVHTRVCRALGTRCCRVVGCGSTWFTHVALCGLGSCLSYVCDLCLTVQDCVDTSACCYHKGMFDRPTPDWPSTPLAPQCRSGLRVVDERRERTSV